MIWSQSFPTKAKPLWLFQLSETFAAEGDAARGTRDTHWTEKKEKKGVKPLTIQYELSPPPLFPLRLIEPFGHTCTRSADCSVGEYPAQDQRRSCTCRSLLRTAQSGVVGMGGGLGLEQDVFLSHRKNGILFIARLSSKRGYVSSYFLLPLVPLLSSFSALTNTGSVRRQSLVLPHRWRCRVFPVIRANHVCERVTVTSPSCIEALIAQIAKSCLFLFSILWPQFTWAVSQIPHWCPLLSIWSSK